MSRQQTHFPHIRQKKLSFALPYRLVFQTLHLAQRALKLRIAVRPEKIEVRGLLIGERGLDVGGDARVREAFSLRRKIFLDRQVDRLAVREHIGALGAALAGGVRADERRALVFLQGRREELGRRNALVVDQHRDRQVDHIRV